MCEALLFEDFKASIKSMKNQGERRFFYRMKEKDYYYEEKKESKSRQIYLNNEEPKKTKKYNAKRTKKEGIKR
jgi:hypothetical protein